MYITLEDLDRRNACGPGVVWFKRTFPQGAEVSEIIQHKYATPHFLHWGYANFATSDQEKALYWEKIEVDCGEKNYTIYESHKVKNSEYVTHSQEVNDSSFVFFSEDVDNSCNVIQSSTVKNSNKIYSSDFVYNSQKVNQSKNVSNSVEIIGSDYVINSHHIYNGVSIKNSAYVTDIATGLTKRITDSFFISNSSDLDHCLFCCGLNDKKYCLFNKEITPDEYELIVFQMRDILEDFSPELVRNNYWPEGTIPLDHPIIQRNIAQQFATLPDRFWRWVKTLPGYDPDILYSLTYIPQI